MFHHLRNPLRIAASTAIVLVALLVPASGAFASTLASDGNTVTLTADTGAGNQFVGLDDNNTDDLYMQTTDDPVDYTAGSNVITSAGDDCVDTGDDGDNDDGSAGYVACTNIDRIVVNTNNGDDFIDANECVTGYFLELLPVTVNGGIGEDLICGGLGDDTLNGNDADDDMAGSNGDDVMNGGAGDEDGNMCCFFFGIAGGNGDDTLRGGDGDDSLRSASGADDSNGEAGNDEIDEKDDGDVDLARGGSGQDELDYDGCDFGCSSNDDVDINENGAEDDGDTEDDPDNDFDEFEIVDVDGHVNSDATATVLSTNGNDTIQGGQATDVFTGRNGVDLLNMRENDDTANTVDGYPDVVNCGPGDDTANADQFDELNGCENVTVTQVPSAFDNPDSPDDLPPSVAFSNLNPNAFLPPIGKHLEATASDDNGVVLVAFFDDTERLCDDTTAPYTCEWAQTSDDVGDNTLTVLAVDTAGQFGIDIQNVEVGKFNPDDLQTKATKRDLNGPRRTRVRGTLDLPSGVLTEDGCEGNVRVRIYDGSDRIRQRLVPVQEDCDYSHRFRLPGAAKFEHENAKIKTKFMGNDVLKKEKGNVVKTQVLDL